MASHDARVSPPPDSGAAGSPGPADGADAAQAGYPAWARALVTGFIAYHVLFLLIGNLPTQGLTRGITWLFDTYARFRSYAAMTGSAQNWTVFAPDPPRANVFLRVLVTDARGHVWDLRQDAHGRRRHPYLFYDRRAKIARRLLRLEAERPLYAAWVCRDWERSHGGQPAREVRFVKAWTRIPPPAAAPGGYDPMSLPVEEEPAETFRCATIVHGQLPDELRRRYGLPPAAHAAFRDVPARSWWARRESPSDDSRAAEGEARDDGGTE
jgi:hypothetical protein